MRKISVFALSLFVIAGPILAQDTPTGIKKLGSITLIRSEGKIAFGSTPPVESITDSFAAAFVTQDYTNYTPPPAQPTTVIGPCTIQTTPVTPDLTPSSPVTTLLDAGPVINISGPNGGKQIPPKNNVYSLMLGGGVPLPFPVPGLPGPTPLYLDPGDYTVDNGGGGADVGPFTATLTISAPAFTWTNADANLTIDRSAGVDLQWIGGDPANNVIIQGSSSSTNPATRQTTGAGFTCLVPNTGDFVVTSDVLSLLPATPASAAAGTGIGLLTVLNLTPTMFTADGIDTGVFIYIAGFARTIVYK